MSAVCTGYMLLLVFLLHTRQPKLLNVGPKSLCGITQVVLSANRCVWEWLCRRASSWGEATTWNILMSFSAWWWYSSHHGCRYCLQKTYGVLYLEQVLWVCGQYIILPKYLPLCGYQAILGNGIMWIYMTGLTCTVGYVNRVGFNSGGFLRKSSTKWSTDPNCMVCNTTANSN